MADRYFGFNFGSDLSPDKVTTGTSTGSTDVEVRVSTTNMASVKAARQDILDILDAIERVLEDGRTATLTA